MQINQVPSRSSAHHRSCRLHLLLLLPVLLIAAGCGQNSAGTASGKEPIAEAKPSAAVKKLSPEAARMELAKLNKDFRPEPFIASTVNGDKMAVELFLAAGMNVNAKNSEGLTALMAACVDGHRDIVAILFGKGSDVNATSALGETALMVAAARGHDDIVRLLLDHNADPKACSDKGVPPLSYAAGGGHTKAMSLLVDKGALVNAQSEQGTTALMWAAKSGRTDAVKFLIDHGAALETKDNDGHVAMDWAGDHTRVRSLLRTAGAKPVTDAVFQQMLVEKWHTSEIIDIIFQNRDKPTFNENALAPIRASYSDELIQKLRQEGFTDCQIAQMIWADWDQLGTGIRTTQRVSAMNRMASGNPESLTDTDNKFLNVLLSYAEDGWQSFEKVFLASLETKWSQPDVRFGMDCEGVGVLGEGWKVNCRFTNITALMLAAGRGRTDMAKTLLQKGASPDAKDSAGKTALDYAVQYKQQETAQLLSMARDSEPRQPDGKPVPLMLRKF